MLSNSFKLTLKMLDGIYFNKYLKEIRDEINYKTDYKMGSLFGERYNSDDILYGDIINATNKNNDIIVNNLNTIISEEYYNVILVPSVYRSGVKKDKYYFYYKVFFKDKDKFIKSVKKYYKYNIKSSEEILRNCNTCNKSKIDSVLHMEWNKVSKSNGNLIIPVYNINKDWLLYYSKNTKNIINDILSKYCESRSTLATKLAVEIKDNGNE